MANCIQIITGTGDSIAATASNRYSTIAGRIGWYAYGNGSNACPWSVAGTFRNFVISITTPLAAGTSVVWTLRKNNVNTALTCTMGEGQNTARDTTHEVTVAAGDILALEFDPSASLAVDDTRWSIEFESQNAYASGYGTAHGLTSNLAARYGALLSPSLWTTTTTLAIDVIAAAGTITRLDALISAAQGAGKGYAFNLYLNDVIQDGTSGSVDTTVNCLGTTTATYREFSLSVVAGDLIYVRVVPVDGPSGGVATACAIAFSATTSNYALWSGRCYSATAAVRYTLASYGLTAWAATEEANDKVIGGVSPFYLRDMRLQSSLSPGSGGDAYVFTLRKNGDTPVGSPSVTITDAETTGSDLSGVMTVADGDYLHMQLSYLVTPLSAPTTRWGFVQVYGEYAAWQQADPVADVAVGTWVNESANQTDLYLSIDDGDVDNDNDYIETPATPTNDTYKCTLGNTVIAPEAGDVSIIIRGNFLDT